MLLIHDFNLLRGCVFVDFLLLLLLGRLIVLDVVADSKWDKFACFSVAKDSIMTNCYLGVVPKTYVTILKRWC
jgi:hypothetical protein